MNNLKHIYTGELIKPVGKEFPDQSIKQKVMLIKGKVVASQLPENIGKVFEYEVDNLKKLSKQEFKDAKKEFENPEEISN